MNLNYYPQNDTLRRNFSFFNKILNLNFCIDRCMESNFAPEMPRPLRNIFLLALTMLSVGLQLSAHEVHVHSTSSIETVLSEGLSTASHTFEHTIVTGKCAQSHDQKQLATEIAEEVEEVNENTQTSANLAVSYAYITSFLDFGATRSAISSRYFDPSFLVSSIPLYLQHEVFRL